MPASPFPFAYLLPFVGMPFSLGQGGGALGWPRDGPCLFTLLQVCTQSTELPSLLCPCPSALCSMGQQPLGCMRARAVRCTGGGGGLPPHMSQAGGPTLQTGLNLDPSRKDAKGAGDTLRARSGCVRMRQRSGPVGTCPLTCSDASHAQLRLAAGTCVSPLHPSLAEGHAAAT